MLSSSNTEYQILRIQREDIVSTAALHCKVFPDYFLTHMGQEFLEIFYREFLQKPGYGFVAKRQDEVIGFLVGTADPTQFYSHFYQRNWGRLFPIFIKRFCTDPYIRHNIMDRTAHFGHFIKALFKRNATPPPGPQTGQTSQEPNKVAHLLSIGVKQDFRGVGIAESLTNSFNQNLRQDGIQLVLLSVLPSNTRAIQFYRKTGWQLISETKTILIFSQSLRMQ